MLNASQELELAPSEQRLLDIAQAVRAVLPDAMRAPAADVAIRVVDWPDEDLLDELEIDDAYGLTGLYDGIPLTEKSVSDPGGRTDTIWLFRRPILDEWVERGDIDLSALVTHVYVHELAHHFGWSDEDIAKIDRWWE